MATLFDVKFDEEKLLTEIQVIFYGNKRFILDDNMYDTMEGANQDIEFTTEFCEYLASQLGVEKIEGQKMKAAGTQNTHYQLKDETGKMYLLRMRGIEITDMEELKQRSVLEYTTLKALQGLNAGSFGVYFVDDSKKYTPFSYFVGEFLDGKPVKIQNPLTDSDVVGAAKALKRIHATDTSSLSVDEFKNPFLYAPDLSIVPEFLKDFEDRAFLKEIEDAANDVAPLVEKSKFGLCHGDAHIGNVLISEAGAAYVDWEFCHLGYQAKDVATIIMSHRTKMLTTMTDEQISMALEEYGYGSSLEDKLVFWYFVLKRSVSLNLFGLKFYADTVTPELRKELIDRLRHMATSRPSEETEYWEMVY